MPDRAPGVMPATASMTVLRLLIDSPRDGPTNMARDEALLRRVAGGATPPTLRLYAWNPPTVSLGYFQSRAELLAQPQAVRAMPVVRRLTGGGAIIHRDELTYSLTLPADHRLLGTRPTDLYALVHDATIVLLAGLGFVARRADRDEERSAQRGPFLCFERRHRLDVVVGARKVLGSAQRRTAGAVLQHGSLQLGSDSVSIAALAARFADALAGHAGIRLEHEDWDAETAALAAQLRGKYAGRDWTGLR